ncbi:glycoside hydrolase family 18 protein, partial [Cucurbitaria berberidis CBS 394.84]
YKSNVTLILFYPDGVWDSIVKSIAPYAYAHTNLTEIQLDLELLWRNNINSARVVMGLGFYGRSTSPEHQEARCPTGYGF